jgi:hypothetical protein
MTQKCDLCKKEKSFMSALVLVFPTYSTYKHEGYIKYNDSSIIKICPECRKKNTIDKIYEFLIDSGLRKL